MHAGHLSQAEKQQLFADGYIIIKDAVPYDISQRARELITASLPEHERRLLAPPELATHEHVLGLFKDTCLSEILRTEMGPFPDVISCQVAVTPGGDQLGGEPGPHVDGSWSGDIPTSMDEIEPGKGRPYDAQKYFGKHDDIRGANDGQLWIDPERRISIGSYTALVGVCLNDQRVPGNGQFGVLKGLHPVVQDAFRMQRDSGSVIGPEGTGWPRILGGRNGRPYCNGLPGSVREIVKQRRAEGTATKDWPWPELTPVCLEQGDAVIALHACPHTPTPNLGSNPRMNVYFRLRRLREDNPHEGTRRIGHGVSDHPDRGYFGQFLEYPEHYDPWQTSIDKLCDHWSEWDGMQEVAAAAQDA
ncbi:MAG: hypothetical protein AAF513_10650 [Pseudomonadota bacterium]